MGIPELIYLLIVFVGLGIVLAKDGQPADDHNFTVSLISTLAILGLLYWGDFFSESEFPSCSPENVSLYKPEK